MSDQIAKFTADSVTAYLGKTATNSAELPGLISATYKALVDARENGPTPPSHTHDHHRHGHHHNEVESHIHGQEPAVDPRKSVFEDRIICLEDGLSFKTIKRHLGSAHGITVDEYRRKWGLPFDYPVVAPGYKKQRSKLAKASGPGRK